VIKSSVVYSSLTFLGFAPFASFLNSSCLYRFNSLYHHLLPFEYSCASFFACAAACFSVSNFCSSVLIFSSAALISDSYCLLCFSIFCIVCVTAPESPRPALFALLTTSFFSLFNFFICCSSTFILFLAALSWSFVVFAVFSASSACFFASSDCADASSASAFSSSDFAPARSLIHAFLCSLISFPFQVILPSSDSVYQSFPAPNMY
jgi:hypothetical protein